MGPDEASDGPESLRAKLRRGVPRDQGGPSGAAGVEVSRKTRSEPAERQVGSLGGTSP